MTSINTNVGALKAHNNMLDQSSKMEDAMTRLSSGLRINSAADDAAGSAIASKMEAQVRSLGVAIRNSYDAISMTQTAEGALGEMENILQRVRELAVQAGNSTLSAVDRSMIQNEVDALLKEVDAIAGDTNFNGVNLLSGANANVNFQIGIDADDSLEVNLEKSDTQALGLAGSKGVSTLTSERISKTNYAATGASLAKADVKINGFDALSAAYSTNLSSNSNAAKAIADAINLQTGVHGATADAFNTLTSVDKGPFAQTSTFTINGDTVALATSYNKLVENINEAVSGIVAVLNSDNTITLSNKTGSEIVIAEGSGTTGAADVGFTAGTYTGMISLENNDGSKVRIEAGNSANGYAKGLGTIADVNALGFNESSDGNVVESAVVSGAAIVADELSLNDVLVGPSDNGTAFSIAKAINDKTAEHGVTANAKTQAELRLNTTSIPSQMSINGNNVILSTAVDVSGVVSAINTANIGDIRATTNSDGKLILTSESGVDIKVSHNTSSDFIESYKDINGTESFYGLQKGITDKDYVVASATINTTATLTAAVQANTNLNSFVTINDLAGNAQTGVVYTIVGTDMDGNSLTETITGPVASKSVVGTNVFKTITSVTTDGTTTGAVSVGLVKASTDIDSLVTSTDIGAAGAYVLNGTLANNTDLDAFVMISSAGNDSSNTFTITGTDRFGNVISESIAGGNIAPVQTTKRFGSVTAISANADMGSVQIGTTREFGALQGSGTTSTTETHALQGLLTATDINAAGAYTLNGALKDFTDLGAVVQITSTGNDSSGTFTVTGTDMNGQTQTETIAGANASAATGTKIFKTVGGISVDIDAGSVKIGAISVYDSFNVRGNLSLSTDKNSTIKIDTVAADNVTAMTAGSGGVEASLQKIGLQKQGQSFEVTGAGLDMLTEAGALKSLADIDAAITQVSSFRASFGAVENRIDAAINNLNTLKLNTEASQARIQDADFAAETSKMTKAQILSQAATSMLAQANASKQNLLALLQG